MTATRNLNMRGHLSGSFLYRFHFRTLALRPVSGIAGASGLARRSPLRGNGSSNSNRSDAGAVYATVWVATFRCRRLGRIFLAIPSGVLSGIGSIWPIPRHNKIIFQETASAICAFVAWRQYDGEFPLGRKLLVEWFSKRLRTG